MQSQTEIVERNAGILNVTGAAGGPVANPFESARAVAVRGGNAVADQTREREIAEVKGMMVIAKQFPRDERNAMDRILNACQRRGLAERATYSYARGGTEITGPSIRLAEVIAQHWGNLVSGIREVEQRNGESTVEAFAWDIETNRRESRVFQVSHWRHRKDGTGYRLTDPRDIYEMVANQGARRLRACVLAIVPGDVTEAAVAQCEQTLAASVEVNPARIQAMLDKFRAVGVDKVQIEARIQRRIESIQPAQVISLGKIYNSIEAGMSTAAEWFDPDPISPDREKATADTPSSGKRATSARDKLKAAARAEAAEQPETDLAQNVVFASAEGTKASRDGGSRTDCPPDLPDADRAAWLEAFDATEAEQISHG